MNAASGAEIAVEAPASARIPLGSWYVLAILTLVNAVAYLDRQITAILLEPIRQDLGLNDTQLGFLSGVAFALFYATMGIPIARLADRGRRKNIIAVCLTLFSAMTAVCGMAREFWQLALARVMVGVGEGGTTPPMHTIIADLFPRAKRATAIAIYGIGVNLGMLVGFLFGGWIAQLYGWRTAFLVAGGPGLILAVIVYTTVREPARGQSDGLAEPPKHLTPPLSQALKWLLARPSYFHTVAGASLYSLASFSLIAWTPAFLARSYGMQPAEIGGMLALVLGALGAVGTLAFGFLGDFLGRQHIRRALWSPTLALVILALGTAGMLLSHTKSASLLFFVAPACLISALLGPCTAIVQALSPLRMRVTSAAIFMFMVNLFGMGVGAQVVGILSDFLRPTYGEEALRHALLYTVMVAAPWGVFHLIRAGRTLKEDIASAQEANTGVAA